MLDGWDAFFTTSASASAALVGLIIVGMSVNLDTLIKYAGLVSRAATAIAMLVLVTMVSLAALIPEMDDTAFGITVLALAAVGLGFALRSLWVLMRDVDGGRQLVAAITKGGFAVLPFIAFAVGGLLATTGGPGATLWIAFASIGAVLLAIVDVWVMLVEVRR